MVVPFAKTSIVSDFRCETCQLLFLIFFPTVTLAVILALDATLFASFKNILSHWHLVSYSYGQKKGNLLLYCSIGTTKKGIGPAYSSKVCSASYLRLTNCGASCIFVCHLNCTPRATLLPRIGHCLSFSRILLNPFVEVEDTSKELDQGTLLPKELDE